MKVKWWSRNWDRNNTMLTPPPHTYTLGFKGWFCSECSIFVVWGMNWILEKRTDVFSYNRDTNKTSFSSWSLSTSFPDSQSLTLSSANGECRALTDLHSGETRILPLCGDISILLLLVFPLLHVSSLPSTLNIKIITTWKITCLFWWLCYDSHC